MKRRYSNWHLLFDLVMTVVTGGFWILVPIYKFLRTNTKW